MMHSMTVPIHNVEWDYNNG